MEVEYIILSKIAKKFKWVSIFVADFKFAIQKLLMIYCDSESAIIFLDIKGIIYYRWIKYIDIRHHYIKERVEDGEIKLFYILIFEIIVDGLMKPLLALLFVRNIK